MASHLLRERFNISRLALKHPRLTIGFWVAVTIAGIVSFSSLKYALFPDITFPVVVVDSTYPSQFPEDTEETITNPIEASLRTLPGLYKLRSSSYPGRSVVSLALEVGEDLETSRNEVESRVRALALPRGTRVRVLPVNLNESAVVSYAVLGEGLSSQQLARLAREQVVSVLLRVPGVLKVEVLGERDRRQGATGVRLNGQDGLALQVVKRERANTLQVVRQVDREVKRLETTLKGVRLPMASTQADYIREASNATVEALALAIALSVLVIFPFLWNWRATVISALAIPTSLLGTFIVMALLGFNLETITLLALALVIGIIIDDAIVDVENIARHLEAGEAPAEAAIRATDEIGLTVTAATMTIVAVFLPVGLMGGTLGQFFRPFGITVSVAVVTSLLVARTLSPLLASRWLVPGRTAPPAWDGAWNHLLARYRQILNWSLTHRSAVLGMALVSFVLGLGLIPFIPKGFIPHLDRGEFNVNFAAPLGSPVATSLQTAVRLEQSIRAFPEVEAVYTIVGGQGGQESHRGTINVRLRDERTTGTFELQERLRRELPAIEGVDVSVEDIPFVENGTQKSLEVAILNDDLDLALQGATALRDRLARLPGFVELTLAGAAEYEGIPVEIAHLDGKRTVYVTGNLGGGLTIGEATDRVRSLAKTVLPAGTTIRFGGETENVSNVFNGFAVTLFLSVGCILAVLVFLFRNWRDPLVVIFSLPLAIVGAMLAQFAARSEFGMISVIGLIFLLGLTNKNAILLVDYINQLRSSGLPAREAILQASPIRLRPILMTTAAAVLGMVPIALGLGAGAELRAPMAVTIIGGLLTSTLLSLVVVPVAYSLLSDFKLFKS